MNVIRYHFEDGSCTALLVNRGRKFISLIPMATAGSGGLRVVKIPLREERRIKPVLYHGQPYPEARAIKHFRKAYRKFGGSQAVKAAIYGGGK